MQADNIKEEFEQIYADKIVPIANIYEQQRLRLVRKYRFYHILTGIFLVLYIIPIIIYVAHGAGAGRPKGVIDLFAQLYVIFVFCCFIPMFFAHMLNDEFRWQTKNSILKLILNIFGEFKIRKESVISASEVSSLGIYADANGQIYDDSIEGKYKGKSVALLETVLNYTEKRSKTSDFKLKFEGSLFRGIIIKIELEKKLSGLCVLYDKMDLHAKPLNTGRPFEKIVLEDVRLNKEYEIYGTDQIEARCILTPAFMERIRSIQRRFSAKTASVALRDNNMYVFLGDIYRDKNAKKYFKSVSFKGGFFEVGSITQTLKDKRIYEKTLCELFEIISLVDFLNSSNSSV